VVPNESAATSGRTAPAPSASHCLSPAARCSRRQLAEPAGRRRERRQPVAVEVRDPPLPVQARGPAAVLEVERQVADLAGGRIHPLAGEAGGQPGGQHPVASDPLPHRRLEALDPVGLGVGLESRDGLADAAEPERDAPQPADRPEPLGPTLIQPDDRRTQRTVVLVGDDQGDPLGGQRDAGHAVRPDRAATSGRRRPRCPELPAGLADGGPPDLRVLLRPAGLGRDIRLDRHPAHRHQDAGRVEEERADTLGADVDRQRVVGRTGNRASLHRSPPRRP